ncbi:invasion protein [Paenibacillus sp. 598K]|uniref:FAD-dependent oxidoreductase n=1 Tax=Paenibacillus sp. 598K TaxID=1117987 RepID=UPI000FFA26A1|nr:FAD-dependent oxidoreductase [Paenibacillus sp. 598K]GBF76841.1 invasion protein [Paenibacillus sp. 598K]
MATKTYHYSTDVPIVAELDVLVIGGGPAGIAAALAAAQAGARTALVERYGFLGGNATAGLVGPFMTAFSGDSKQQLIKGVFDELVTRMEQIGGAIHPRYVEAGTSYAGFFDKGHGQVTPFDPEAVKLVAAEMMEEAGVQLFLHSFFLETITGENGVEGALILNKSGTQAIRAQVTIDCSADADVADRAGAKTEKGRTGDGLTQPMTMFFRIAGVEDEKVEQYILDHPDEISPFSDIVEAARKRGEWKVNKDQIGLYKTVQPGVWRVNTTRISGKDGTKVEDLVHAELEGRRQVFFLMNFFRKHVPGFSNASLVDTASQVGVRETRRLVGEYMLTAEDLITGKAFDDVIALYSYPIDLHSPTGGAVEFDENYHTANVYQLPYRILVPIETDGLLVAGRCVSATHEAHAAIRVMPCAFALGQAAGVGAAIAVKAKVHPREVDMGQVQQELRRQGVVLPAREQEGRDTI